MKEQIAPNTFLEYDLAGKGPTVVFLHAFPLCRSMWRAQTSALQGKFQTLAPDFRGFGGSSPFEQTPSIDRLAR